MPDWRSPAFSAADIERYHEAGWWSENSLSDAVRRNAERTPGRVAYRDEPGAALTWRQFDRDADELAARLAGAGVAVGDRIAVWHGDSAAIHLLYVAIERCGAVFVGIGARAGTREVGAILAGARPTLLIVDGQRRDVARTLGVPALTVAELGAPAAAGPQLGPDDVFLINSTSGTTGLPKCVVHTQNRWHYFHRKAVANGALTADDVFLPVIPTPFGFGLWTSHTTPIHLGATAVLLERFTTAATWAAIAEHRVSVLCCVSTQLTMLMADPGRHDHDLSSLRVVFTGGEAVPYRPAVDFEALTGATILQFYGSNETGLLSATTLADPPERRLRTGGRIVAEMAVRLYDGDTEVTATGHGQPACRGPATSLGYLDGTDSDKLFTADGWMRMGDICDIDAGGYLTVSGRTSDFILRGGKNISAAQVEDAVVTHPTVALAAAVAMPDEVFGEKVCCYVELVDGADGLELSGLIDHLLAQGVSKELLPERLVVLDELPRSSGGKVAKGVLREGIRVRQE
ncbi:acyl--CoA ligase [Mycobacterium sp. M1]|uniref:Acyl--CoA ligase n=1 Tax=Mycolicibacter acidiphilus TaxID=2835306 RepID=A0ABS5RJ99_9MYCO|nr:class I adenylate-forming enzyme family protein [Mycolicibacter acidiphilus]MBS9533556.1 acyl--CoA ligase [Mycolicibacter acidiphilus]